MRKFTLEVTTIIFCFCCWCFWWPWCPCVPVQYHTITYFIIKSPLWFQNCYKQLLQLIYQLPLLCLQSIQPERTLWRSPSSVFFHNTQNVAQHLLLCHISITGLSNLFYITSLPVSDTFYHTLLLPPLQLDKICCFLCFALLRVVSHPRLYKKMFKWARGFLE